MIERCCTLILEFSIYLKSTLTIGDFLLFLVFGLEYSLEVVTALMLVNQACLANVPVLLGFKKVHFGLDLLLSVVLVLASVLDSVERISPLCELL